MADRSLVSWDGVVEAVRHATLSSQTSGRVAGVYVDIGDHVAAGAVLLRLTAVEQQADSHIAQAELAAAQAQLAQAQAYWKRIGRWHRVSMFLVLRSMWPALHMMLPVLTATLLMPG